MTLVKICGITNLHDALDAAEAGADMLGFNFYDKSPRYVGVNAVCDILREVNVKAVGVFVNDELRHVCEIAAAARLDAIQLHGDEPPEFVRDLAAASGLEIIKAFRVGDGFHTGPIFECRADAVLLDSFAKNEFGGTGESFDWRIAVEVAAMGKRLYLAGGLSPENVAEAIDAVHPYAVDACSLLESAKGRKDATKVRRFIANAKGYDDI
jgi:phosphoribosylanthranilate isomerase